ncbi:unnamed protein product [Protopolystoma xenopodis]|uniref:Uncharacterized protein n=1 Tax=Protopolystoma xenopodis TaxID=117903 RepID=A0A3S5CTW5_9PLAT|nr:unnamed protein product [Protopolystoma xenopodis]
MLSQPVQPHQINIGPAMEGRQIRSPSDLPLYGQDYSAISLAKGPCTLSRAESSRFQSDERDHIPIRGMQEQSLFTDLNFPIDGFPGGLVHRWPAGRQSEIGHTLPTEPRGTNSLGLMATSLTLSGSGSGIEGRSNNEVVSGTSLSADILKLSRQAMCDSNPLAFSLAHTFISVPRSDNRPLEEKFCAMPVQNGCPQARHESGISAVNEIKNFRQSRTGEQLRLGTLQADTKGRGNTGTPSKYKDSANLPNTLDDFMDNLIIHETGGHSDTRQNDSHYKGVPYHASGLGQDSELGDYFDLDYLAKEGAEEQQDKSDGLTSKDKSLKGRFTWFQLPSNSNLSPLRDEDTCKMLKPYRSSSGELGAICREGKLERQLSEEFGEEEDDIYCVPPTSNNISQSCSPPSITKDVESFYSQMANLNVLPCQNPEQMKSATTNPEQMKSATTVSLQPLTTTRRPSASEIRPTPPPPRSRSLSPAHSSTSAFPSDYSLPIAHNPISNDPQDDEPGLGLTFCHRVPVPPEMPLLPERSLFSRRRRPLEKPPGPTNRE